MFILSAMTPLSTVIEAFVDAIMVTILVFPAMYFFSFRPLIRHIREREQAEHELYRIRAAVDDATDAVLIVDQKEKPTYFNVAFGHLFGCKPAEMEEERIDFLFADREFARDIIDGLRRGVSCRAKSKWYRGKIMISPPFFGPRPS
jgi:PAS domain-containing protein